MRKQTQRILTTLGLLGCVAMTVPACFIATSGRATVSTQTVAVADTEPPAPQYQTNVGTRAGHVWVKGHWQWQNRQWVWKKGHWERARQGYAWQAGRWERRGAQWHWVPGQWIVVQAAPVAQYPTSAPPAPQYQTNIGTRAGYVWVKGHYQWQNGRYVWKKGHWERARKGHQWRAGRWEMQNRRYVWVPGEWTVVATRPPVVVGPTAPPPRPTYERPKPRRGYVWVTGHYEWQNGRYVWKKGHWERARKGYIWQAGRWERRGNRFVWVPGQFVVVPTGPAGPNPRIRPPAPRYKVPKRPRAGYVWVKGRYEWRNGKYVWKKGRWERMRKGYKWQGGYWQRQGINWVWVPGKWLTVAVAPGGATGPVPGAYPSSAPPAPRFKVPKKPRRGYIWVKGHYQWQNGRYQWKKGHWERARKGYQWQAGRWELKNRRYVWTPGQWVVVAVGPADKPAVVPGNHPTSAPPAPRFKVPKKPRRGYVWVKGHYQWQNGRYQWKKGHWERARKGYQWQAGRWELKNRRYVWTPGQWVVVAVGPGNKPVVAPGRYPTKPPPAPRADRPGKKRAGYIWVAGHYEWQNGKYVWKKGHWERARKAFRWQAGRWQRQGKRYVWKPGSWVKR